VRSEDRAPTDISISCLRRPFDLFHYKPARMAPKPAKMLAAIATKGPIPIPIAFKLVRSTRRSAAPELRVLDVGLVVLPPGLPDVVVVTFFPVPVDAPELPVGEEADVKREAAAAYNTELS